MAAAACVGYGLHTARQTVLFSGCCYIHVWETGCIERDRQTESLICWLLLYTWEIVAKTETVPFAGHCYHVREMS